MFAPVRYLGFRIGLRYSVFTVFPDLKDIQDIQKLDNTETNATGKSYPNHSYLAQITL